jgi:antitoxin (DNA-binding transcriptional repressor) of toxin-antitoxin stability system
LLDLVEQGEEITITRHGKEVAQLVPARPMRSRDQARAAPHRMRARRTAFRALQLERMESLP